MYMGYRHYPHQLWISLWIGPEVNRCLGVMTVFSLSCLFFNQYETYKDYQLVVPSQSGRSVDLSPWRMICRTVGLLLKRFHDLSPFIKHSPLEVAENSEMFHGTTETAKPMPN